jgi:NCAIR mutase (PurE)-related protein
VSNRRSQEWRALLESVAAGRTPVEQALLQLGLAGGPGLHLDPDREARCGVPEVVFGAGKTTEQIEEALRALSARSGRGLATRVDLAAGRALAERLPGARWHEGPRCLVLQTEEPGELRGHIAVLCAGTSDLPVAEEACVTAEFLGSRVTRHFDVGVAGLHRLLESQDEIRPARAIVVVAGMEGALPSVVGGLLPAPVVAVPTSVGYGANLGGLTALLGMLNSCAPGVSVVNIDNGFGAAVVAHKIDRAVTAQQDSSRARELS